MKIGSSSQSCDIFEDKVFHFDDNYSNEQLIRYILKKEEIPKKAVHDIKLGLKSHGDHKFFSFDDCNLISTYVKLLEPSDEEIVRHLKHV